MIFTVLILAESANMFKAIFIDRAHTYSINKIFYDQEQMENFNITLGKYNNSANFVFGVFYSADSFDV